MRLEEDGVAVSLDQYEDPPDWALWMEQQVKEPQFVLMVCTEAYSRRVSGEEEPGRGAGATFEGSLIRKLIVESSGRDARFIPILLTRVSDPAHIPIFVNGRHYKVYEADDYSFLLHRIQGRSRKELVQNRAKKLHPRSRPDASAYTHALRSAHKVDFYIPRFFATRDDWDRMAGHGSLLSGWREFQPSLQQVLSNQHVAILGEPGAGKSTLAHVAVLEFLKPGQSVTPVYAPLGDYRGSLSELLLSNDLNEALTRHADSPPTVAAYILDGIDEVPTSALDAFLSDLRTLVANEPNSRVILTVRQAFYPTIRASLPASFVEFYPVGFNADDIETFAEHCGIASPEAFLRALHAADVADEATNPFVLRVLIEVFQRFGKLQPVRSDNLERIIGALVATRTRFQQRLQERALHLLALAMEVYGRNELTFDEAVAIITSPRLAVSQNEAKGLLAELDQTSLLVRTSNGYSFPMRSYGEFLAAKELDAMSSVSLDDALSLIRLPQSSDLSETWRNTVGYFVELNHNARAFFVRNHPEWVLPASRAAFTDKQAALVVRGILEPLAERGRYLVLDDTVHHLQLAKFCRPDDETWLRDELAVESASRRANAVVVLGHLKACGIADLALQLAVDQTNNPFLRRSAFVALATSGGPQHIPALIATYSDSDPLESMHLDIMGSLATPETLKDVLPYLKRTTTYLSNASGHIANIRSPEMLRAVLDVFLSDRTIAIDDRIASYVKPVWRTARFSWKDDVQSKTAELLLRWNREGPWDQQIPCLSDIMEVIWMVDKDAIVARKVFEGLLLYGEKPYYLWKPIGQLCDPAVAAWLAGMGNAAEGLIRNTLPFLQHEAREVFRPVVPDVFEQQDTIRIELEREETERQKRTQTILESRQVLIAESENDNEVLGCFESLPNGQWPALPQRRREWLGNVVSARLKDLGLPNSINWLSATQFRRPTGLPLLCDLVSHYSLRVTDDRLLVHAVLAGHSDSLAAYYRALGLSAPALEEFERYIDDLSTPAGAISSFLNFLATTDYDTPRVRAALLKRLANPVEGEQGYSASWCVEILARRTVTEEELLNVLSAERTMASIREAVVSVLTDRQHVPTIDNRLAGLTDEDLLAADVEFAASSPLDWIGKIKAEAFWDKLTELRLRALRLRVWRVNSLIESALSRIAKLSLVRLMEEQFDYVPAAWQEAQKSAMDRYRREAVFDRAKAISFDEVLERLRGVNAGTG